MLIKLMLAMALALAFFYRMYKDAKIVYKQLDASEGGLLYYEVLNRRVLLSIIPWLISIWYYEKISFVIYVILYELVLYIFIISVAYTVYKYINRSGINRQPR